MADAEVKTRLVIEQDGDPQVFRDAATAVRELVAALQSVGGVSFAPLLAQLDQVIAKAKEAAAAVAQVTGQ